MTYSLLFAGILMPAPLWESPSRCIARHISAINRGKFHSTNSLPDFCWCDTGNRSRHFSGQVGAGSYDWIDYCVIMMTGMPQFPDGTRLRQFDSRGYSSIRDCSHVYSDGSNVTAIFPDRQDKYRILDLLAVAAFETGVRILVAEVMTTHFHAIVSGTETCREQFKVSVWRKLAAWVARNGLDGCISGGLALINDPIKETDELKSKIMYVYRNSLCAGIPLVPWQYEGGPGDIYFIDHAHEGLKGTPLSDLPARKVREYFHTMAKLPPSWRYDEVERRLLPHSYMDWSRVEGLFKTLRAFVAFLAQKKDLETKFDLECAAGAINKASEKDLRLEILNMCRETYHLDRVSLASLEQRTELAARLWASGRTYSLSVLSRIALLPKDYLHRLFSVD